MKTLLSYVFCTLFRRIFTISRQASTMEPFAKTFKNFQSLTIFAKRSDVDIWHAPKYAADLVKNRL